MTLVEIRAALYKGERISNCSRAHVGCVIGYTDNTIRIGANFNPTGATCDHPEVQGGCGCLHAEVVAAAGSDRDKSVDWVAVSIAPCAHCAKVISLLHPNVVYWMEPSRVTAEGTAVFDKLGIPYLEIGRA